MINRENFEAYLLDLMEGRLTAKEQQELHDFLQSHPDCPAGPAEMKFLHLEKDPVSFPDRSQLKKEFPGPGTRLTAHNFDLYCIARMEGDLDPEQEDAHEAMMTGNEELRQEWKSWQQTLLHPEMVSFPHKSRLRRRKRSSSRIIWIGIAAAAAAVALMLLVFTPGAFIQETEMAEAVNPVQTDPEELAQTDPEITMQTGQEDIGSPEQENIGSPEQDASSPVHTGPALFSIRRGPAGSATMNKGEKEVILTEPGIDSLNQAVQDQSGRRPVRIAERIEVLPVPGTRSAYDRIEPLQVPSASVHLSSISLSQLRELDLQALYDDFTQEKNLSLWTIANAGFKGINRIAGTEMSLMAYRDDDGSVSGVRFSSRRLNFTAPLSRSE